MRGKRRRGGGGYRERKDREGLETTLLFPGEAVKRENDKPTL